MYSNYSVDVLVNNKPVTTYKHEGDVFIEGRPGSEYSIKIYNHSGTRVKAVVSVDGLSVIDGEPASEKSKGYVIEPYGNVVIDGWRTDLQSVRKFAFGSKGKSYSAKSGQGTTNVGVIGVMFFQQEQQPVYRTTLMKYPSTHWYDYHPIFFDGNLGTPVDHNSIQTLSMTNTSGMSNTMQVGSVQTRSMSAASGTASVNNLGTQFGDAKKSSAHKVHYQFDKNIHRTSVIYYDDRRGLEARGIVVDKRKEKPNPFPASTGFCKQI